LEEVIMGLTALVVPIAFLVMVVYFLIVKKDSVLKLKLKLKLNLNLKALSTKAQNLIQGLHALEDTSSYWKLISSTLAIWLLNCFAIWSIMMALGIQLNINQTILLVGITGISAAIPAAPAGIGTLQYAFHIAAILFDFSPSAALVAATIVQLALLGSATVVGAMVYSYAVYNHLMRADEATT
jgi:uncharacterized membrane protein YbhN (UPF0104 family)